jgi:hypothetical protein
MKYLFTILLIVLCASTVTALQFTAPTDGQTYTGATSVTFTWDTPANLTVDGTLVTQNATTYTNTLGVGNHTAVATTDNETATRAVTINEQPTLAITISTDKPTYEVGESSRIHLSVSAPVQLTLTVQRNNVVVDTYTVNVQQNTDFLYPVLTVGTYAVTAQAQGTTTLTTFAVQNTTLGVTINGEATATAGRVTTYTAAVSGGTTPYTYTWQFSDNTTSSGATVDHVFSTPGNYTATVVVQDSANRQASTTKAIVVNEQLYTLSVTVMSDQRKLLSKAVITLTTPSGGKTEITDAFGEAKFRKLSANNYTINVTYPYNSSKNYTLNQSFSLTENDDLLFTFTLPVEQPATPVTPTPASTPAPATPAPPAPQPEAREAAPVVDEAALVAEAAAAQLDEQRASALTTLQQTQETLLRSEEKQVYFTVLGLEDIFNKAATDIAAAETEAAMTAILATVPKDIIVLTKDVSSLTSPEDYDTQLAEFFSAQSILDKDVQKQYKYNIDRALEEHTVTTQRTVVRLTIPNPTIPTVYTIFSREAHTETPASYVEFIPKSVAADASELHLGTNADVLVDDPVVQFHTSSYKYYVLGDSAADNSVILPIPSVLVPTPSLLGYVTVKLQATSFARGSLYAILLGVVFVALLAGNIYMRKSNTSTQSFIEIAELTLSSMEQGSATAVAKHLHELETIHKTLSKREQEETKDILLLIRERLAVKQFQATVDHVSTVLELNDVPALAAAYERVLQQYEVLPPNQQEQLASRLTTVQEQLERHVEQHGPAHP